MTNTPPTTFGGLERPAAFTIEHAHADPRGTVEGPDPPSLQEVIHPDGPAEVEPTLTALVRVCSGASIGLGLAVLAGWTFGIGRLESVVSGMTSMRPPTAVAFVLIGLAILASGNTRWIRAARLVTAGGVGLIAGLVTLEHGTGWDLRLDHLLFAGSLRSPHAGRMALATAIEFLVIAGGVLALVGRRRLLAQALGVASLAGASMTLLGYLYGVRSLYSTGPSSTMAVHTAVGLGVASVGLLAAIPGGLIARIATGSSPGSMLMRRLLPVIVIGMPVIGWIRLEGQRNSLYGTAFGLSMMVVASIVVVIATSWRASVGVDRSVELLRSARGELAEANATLEARVAERTSELARSEERYRVLVEQMPAVVYVWDTDSDAGALYVSPQIVEMLGYPVEDWYTGGWIEFVHPDDREAVLDAIDRAVTRGDPYVEEYRYVAADGRVVWVRDECQPLHSEASDTRHLFQGVMVDITERKRAQAALEEAHQHLSATLEASPLAIYTLDLEGTVLSWNPAAERMFGWTAEEAIGRFLPNVGPNGRVEFAELRNRLVDEGGFEQLDRVRFRKDGSLVEVSLSAAVLRDAEGMAVGAISVNADVGERRRAERELAHSREQLAEAQRIARIGSFEVDLHTGETLWSDEMYRIYGVEPNTTPSLELAGSLVHPDDREAWLERWQRITREPGAHSYEHRIRRPDGTVRVIHREGRLELDADGKPSRLLGTSQDVTEQREAEEALRAVNQQLRAILEASPVAIFVVDLDGTVRSWNPGAERIFGWSADEAIGRVVPMVPEDRLAEFEASRDRLVTDGWQPEMERVRRRKDGSLVDVSLSTGLLRDVDGSPAGIVAVMTDISERKRTERELERGRAQLAEAQRIAKIGSFERDLHTQEGLWSEEMYRIHGLEPGPGAPPIDAVIDLVPVAERDRFLEATERSVETGAPLSIDYRIRTPSGDDRILHREWQVEHESDGRPSRILGTVQDVTEWREAEHAVREAEARYRTLVEQIPAMTYFWSGTVEEPQTTLENYVGPQAATITGYTADELLDDIGIWTRCLHPEDRDRVVAGQLEFERSGDRFHDEYRIVRKDGRIVWVEDDAVVISRSPGQVELQGVLHDVSERKRAEESLREAEARYRTLVEQIPAVTFLDRVEPGAALMYTPIYVSPQVEDMFGLCQQEWLSGEMTWATRIHADDRERVERDAARSVSERRPIAQEYRMIGADGREIWVHEDSHPVGSDPTGAMLWQGVMYDVTERKRTEQVLRESEAELQRSLEVLQRTDEERRQLLANLLVAEDQHRVRMAEGIEDRSLQDVTALGLRLESLRRRLDDPEQLGALDRMGETVNATIERLRHLLVELHPRVLEKDGLGSALREYLSAVGGEAGLDVVFHDRLVEEPDVDARIVAYRIAQEAVSNAVRHANAAHLAVEAESSVGGVRICVSDDGCGFDPDHDEPGDRLGLASMRERAELAGGWFRLRSDPKAGTAVEFWVPARSRS